MITLLLYSLLAVSPLEGFPVGHWLEPAVFIEHVIYIPAVNDPNKLLKVSRLEIVHCLDMSDFAKYARQYPGSPDYPSGYYVCPKNKDMLYHRPYPECSATKGYKMNAILNKDLGKYKPCPVCKPPVR